MELCVSHHTLIVQALAVGGISQCVFVVWEGYSQEIP